MQKVIAFAMGLAFASAFTSDLAAQGTRIIRIHFVAASESSASNSALNTDFASYSSQAGYDAVWEVEIPADDFPNAFGPPNVLYASGHTNYKTKSGNGGWDGNLSYDPNPAFNPTAEPYNFNGDTVTIRIAAPHTVKAIRNDNAPASFQRMLYSYFANTDKNETVIFNDYTTTTTLTPVFPDLPGDPNAGFGPISKGNWAVFPVSIANTPTSVSFTFEQTTNGPTEESRIRWRGWVSVSENPGPGLPAPSNPFAFFSQTPPFTPTPAGPEATPTPGGGGPSPTPSSSPQPTPDITQWEKLPKIIQDLFDNITTVIKKQASQNASGAKARDAGLNREPRAAGNAIKVALKVAMPVAGSLKVMFTLKKPKARTVQTITIAEGSRKPLRVTLPRSLVNAIKNGDHIDGKLTLQFTPSLGGAAIKRSGTLSVKARD